MLQPTADQSTRSTDGCCSLPLEARRYQRLAIVPLKASDCTRVEEQEEDAEK